MDVYNLIYSLDKLHTYPNMGIASNSGHLLLDQNNRISRLLPWALVEDGKLKEVDILTEQNMYSNNES